MLSEQIKPRFDDNGRSSAGVDMNRILLSIVRAAGVIGEIVIPFKTLRFKPGQSVWGLNFERGIKRHNERWLKTYEHDYVSSFDRGTIKFQYNFRF
jgi:hypothetical protein